MRAIWESLEMVRSIALQNGLAYTHIGNPETGHRPPMGVKRPHRVR